MKISHCAALLLLAAAPWIPAGAQTLRSMQVDTALEPQTYQPITVHLEFNTPGGHAWCGLHVDFGDGLSSDYRVDEPRSLAITHTYPAPGTYQIRAEGRAMMRGLSRAGPCTVYAPPIAVAVADMAARRQAAAEAQIRRDQEEARQREAEAQRQALEAREAELRAREVELKARELRAREAALRERERELQQQQQAATTGRPIAPVPRKDLGNLDVFK